MGKKTVPANSELMKQLNRSRVLNLIRNYPMSKADISEKTNLTFATVVNIISELSQRGLIYESGYGDSSGGRKPVLYQLNSDFMYVVAVELELSQIKSMIVNLEAEAVAEYCMDIVPTSGSQVIIQQLFQAIDNVINRSRIDRDKIYGIGICSPGPVDHDLGIVLNAPTLKGWSNVPLKQLISERYGLPTIVEKDANAAILGELWFGAAKGKENVINIVVNHGIGGGIIINNRIYRGYHKGAGEIGHGTIDTNGPRCDCGNYGCLEAFSSGIAIVKKVKEEIRRGTDTQFRESYEQKGEDITLEFVTAAAKNGDELSIKILHEAGRYLAVGVSTIINFFSPETIILGGKLVKYYPEIVDIVKRDLKKRVLEHFYNKISIEPSLLGERAPIIGAASVVIEHLFDNSEQQIFEER